ncbi:hypothetical protein ABZX69_08745 [Streptomyces sp. NPDC004074]|uniref:hypothetical protein n=1 Tax=Streptomyces sp. NPDC004074 TaxID=3154277 RepID=UPI0033A2E3E3
MAEDTAQQETVGPATPARGPLPPVLAAAVVGAGASLLYPGASRLATELRHVLRRTLSDVLGSR